MQPYTQTLLQRSFAPIVDMLRMEQDTRFVNFDFATNPNWAIDTLPAKIAEGTKSLFDSSNNRVVIADNFLPKMDPDELQSWLIIHSALYTAATVLDYTNKDFPTAENIKKLFVVNHRPINELDKVVLKTREDIEGNSYIDASISADQIKQARMEYIYDLAPLDSYIILAHFIRIGTPFINKRGQIAFSVYGNDDITELLDVLLHANSGMFCHIATAIINTADKSSINLLWSGVNTIEVKRFEQSMLDF